ncbi:MAG: class I SAM-dependent methyltransferase [Desulfoplanes sp.]
MATIVLKQGREKSLKRFHPWIFSGAIQKVNGNPAPGESVGILDATGQCLGHGSYSPHSQIRVRALSFDPDQDITPELIHQRIQRAIDGRKHILAGNGPGACRLINAESDGLPGLVVDCYDTFLVIQILAMGMEWWRETIIQTLQTLCPDYSIYERSDSEVRRKEGLDLRTGRITGEEPPDQVTIREDAAAYFVNIKTGHKTGFYLDQRTNRTRVARYAAHAEMLNCFSYTGGFGIMSLVWGAERVINIDASQQALDLASKNAELNDIAPERVNQVQGDVFKLLRTYRDEGRQFDIVVLDPPKFAESKAQMNRACRGYKDINLSALKLIRPGGMLFTFSCSGNIDADLFQKVVAGAAIDARRDVQIVEHLFQSPDHPTSIFFPEGTYLKGLGLRVY